MKKLYFTLLISFLSFQNAFAERFEFTPKAKLAYEKAMTLEFQEARNLIYQVKRDDPDNMIIYLVENYIDFFTVFINEDKNEFKQLERNKDFRLKMVKKGPKDSPYYNYTQAEIKLQWALARLKFEEFFTAFNEVSSSYKLLKRNQKKFPNFIANKKSLGILHAMIGTIPDNYQWGVKLLGGMKGDIEQGKNEIEEILKYAKTNEFIFEEETLVMYAFLMLHLKNDTEEAWQSVQHLKARTKVNPLACFALGNIAMRTDRNDMAVEILENRPKGNQYAPFHFLDYMHGLAKLYRLDKDANIYLEKYVQNFHGQNYVKEAYQKLAWHHLVHGDKEKYKLYINQCNTKGAAIIGGDKNALKEAKKKMIPNSFLLKARILYDGGYYQRAYNVLKEKSTDSFHSKYTQLEYTYRLGRITHHLGRTSEALMYYLHTIEKGEDESYYFACNSALQIGTIYEERNEISKAKEYFQFCLSLKPDQYRNGLHQKAKAGLNRIQ